jgi:hypothetical protein
LHSPGFCSDKNEGIVSGISREDAVFDRNARSRLKRNKLVGGVSRKKQRDSSVWQNSVDWKKSGEPDLSVKDSLRLNVSDSWKSSVCGRSRKDSVLGRKGLSDCLSRTVNGSGGVLPRSVLLFCCGTQKIDIIHCKASFANLKISRFSLL